ncbi:MAG: hypothetical protein OHK0022_19050 [Roseiflexaceae bacterium]
MTPASQPYLQVETVEIRLDLRDINASRTIRPDNYEVSIEGVPVSIYAVEPRISTGGPPIRAVELYGLGPAAEQLLQLEARLRDGIKPLQLKDATKETFDISFKRLRSTLALTGTFLIEGDPEEFECSITLSDDTQLSGFALESHWRNQRTLIIQGLSREAQLGLIRTIAAGSGIVVEKIL